MNIVLHSIIITKKMLIQVKCSNVSLQNTCMTNFFDFFQVFEDESLSNNRLYCLNKFTSYLTRLEYRSTLGGFYEFMSCRNI